MSTQLKNLSDKFNLLLTQYTDTYEKYIDILNSGDDSLTIIPNSSFVGKSKIKVLNNSTVQKCKSSCKSNSRCSGATFNINSNSCTLSSGTGNIVPTSKSIAIVQQALHYTHKLQQLNTQLTKINKQMMNATTNSYSQFQQTQQQTHKKDQALQNNYQILNQEREEIDEMIRQFETLNAAYEDGNINVTSNYYSYIILILIAVFLIFILIKFSITGEQRGGGNKMNFSKNYYLIFGLLGFIIVFNSTIKK